MLECLGISFGDEIADPDVVPECGEPERGHTGPGVVYGWGRAGRDRRERSVRRVVLSDCASPAVISSGVGVACPSVMANWRSNSGVYSAKYCRR